MFIHETHNYYIMITLKTPPDAENGYMDKKFAYVRKALSNVGAETLGDHNSVWVLKEVMYSSAEDVFDIVNSEVIRLITADKSLSEETRKTLLPHERYDKFVVSEYVSDNTYTV